MIRVSIVEDNADLRENVRQLLEDAPGFVCCGAHATAEAALRCIPVESPDVVLMDINLPKQSGIECVRQLRKLVPKLPVLMLTVYEDSDRVFESLEAGAVAYLLKRTPPEELLEAIRDVKNGGSPMTSQIARKVVLAFRKPITPTVEATLSSRESEILDLLAQGFLYKEIADKIGIGFETVRWHIRNIYDKLHVRTRTEAVVKHIRLQESSSRSSHP
ncbi:MAG: response regulator transcription factor [Verrucomicrobiota bacterium]|jgi:DNA-binding NarL/FixJ family response regulator